MFWFKRWTNCSTTTKKGWESEFKKNGQVLVLTSKVKDPAEQPKEVKSQQSNSDQSTENN